MHVPKTSRRTAARRAAPARRSIALRTLAAGLPLLLIVPAAALPRSFGDWSAAVSVDPDRTAGVNTAANDGCPIEAPNGHRLFFASNRSGTLDIWAASLEGGRWATDEKLPFPINTDSAAEFCPTPLAGNQLLFVSTRANNCGGAGNNADIYYSRFDSMLGWLEPEPLACTVNSGGSEFSPSLVRAKGRTFLFFSSDREDGVHHKIYVSEQQQDGTWDLALPVSELNLPGASDARPNVRKDGLEIVFDSTRAGTADIYTSSRARISDPWSPPERLGPEVNSDTADETRASLSSNGRRLYFGSTQANAALGGAGGDIYVSTRRPAGHGKP